MPLRPTLRSSVLSAVCVALSAPGAMLLTGCGIHEAAPISPATQGRPLTGMVHGGQQPVSGATIKLYAAGKTGYSSAATSLLTTAVTSDVNGNFKITGDYNCPAGSQVYLTATGGNPGLTAGTNNTASVMVAALGSCSGTLDPNEFIIINEVTTVGAAYALAQFASSATNIGASATNSVGIANAFATANNITDYRDGQARTITPYYAQAQVRNNGLGTTSLVPQARLNTLGDILATCVNSTGASSSACQTLFQQTAPVSGATPLDTFTAALSIAQDPGNNIAGIYSLLPPNGPFQPTLPVSPNDWIVAVKFIGGGLENQAGGPVLVRQNPQVDSIGSVWFPFGTGVAELNYLGEPLSPPPPLVTSGGTPYGGGFTNPSIGSPLINGNVLLSSFVRSLAIDPQDHAWIGNYGLYTPDNSNPSGVANGPLNGNLTIIDSRGNLIRGDIVGSGLFANISALAIDGAGNAWAGSNAVTVSGSYTGANGQAAVSTFSSGGAVISPAGGYIGRAPSGSDFGTTIQSITLDAADHAWVSGNASAGDLTIINRTAETYGPKSTQLADYIAIDSTGEGWTYTGRFAPDLTFVPLGMSLTGNAAIDGTQHTWFTGTSIQETDASGTLLTPASGLTGSTYLPASGTGSGMVSAAIIENPLGLIPGIQKSGQLSGAAFDASGNLWVGDQDVANQFSSGTAYVVEIVGLGGPVITPLSVAVGQNKLAMRP